MRKRIALLALVAAGVAAPAAAVAPSASAAPALAAKSCSGGYVHAYLSWGEKCLRAGEFCKVGNREYLRFRYVCPATGHLRRR
jgi:hypothetical protein